MDITISVCTCIEYLWKLKKNLKYLPSLESGWLGRGLGRKFSLFETFKYSFCEYVICFKINKINLKALHQEVPHSLSFSWSRDAVFYHVQSMVFGFHNSSFFSKNCFHMATGSRIQGVEHMRLEGAQGLPELTWNSWDGFLRELAWSLSCS